MFDMTEEGIFFSSIETFSYLEAVHPRPHRRRESILHTADYPSPMRFLIRRALDSDTAS